MIDTVVERLIGQTTATDVHVEVSLLMPLAALVDPDDPGPATIEGHGPIPAELARHLLHTSQGRRWWRRLFTSPAGQIVGGDPLRRRSSGWLARLVALRDQTCRDPFCDAPIRQLDHIRRHQDGGLTTYANGRGVFGRGNQVRELPGWQVVRVENGADRPHTTLTRTPTGHTYPSRPSRPP